MNEEFKTTGDLLLAGAIQGEAFGGVPMPKDVWSYTVAHREVARHRPCGCFAEWLAQGYRLYVCAVHGEAVLKLVGLVDPAKA